MDKCTQGGIGQSGGSWGTHVVSCCQASHGETNMFTVGQNGTTMSHAPHYISRFGGKGAFATSNVRVQPTTLRTAVYMNTYIANTRRLRPLSAREFGLAILETAPSPTLERVRVRGLETERFEASVSGTHRHALSASMWHETKRLGRSCRGRCRHFVAAATGLFSVGGRLHSGP